MDMNLMIGLAVGVGGSVLATYLVRLLDHGAGEARFRKMARAEADAAATRHAASGIKGDGFTALFLLHRALHLRIIALSMMVCAVACGICGVVSLSGPWWQTVAFFLAFNYFIFREAYFNGRATGLSEVAEEAVKVDGEQADKQSVGE